MKMDTATAKFREQSEMPATYTMFSTEVRGHGQMPFQVATHARADHLRDHEPDF